MKKSRRFERLRHLTFGTSHDREVDEEFAFHLDMVETELVARGLDRGEARTEAERRFGDARRHRADCRQIGERRRRARARGTLISDLLLDVRFGLRTFRENPGFVAMAVLTLALGLAACANVYGMVAALVAPPALPDPQELAIVWATDIERGRDSLSSSVPDFMDFRAATETFEDLGAYSLWEVNLTGVDRPERLYGYRMTANVLDMVGVSPLLGRVWDESEDRADTDDVVVMSYRLWNSRYGGDPEILGREILLDGLSYTVIGIMPQGFEFPQMAFAGDVWAPLQLTPEQRTENRGSRWLTMFGRLRDGVTVRAAQDELAGVAANLSEQFPSSNRGIGVRVVSLPDQTVEPIRPAILILPVMVGFVLLTSCANVANLFLARASTRSAEIAVRSALGASRLRLVRQLLTEGLLISLVAGVVGYGASRVGRQAFLASVPEFIKNVVPASVDGRADAHVLWFSLGLATLTVLLFGLAPALHASRLDLQRALKGHGPNLTGERESNRMRSFLVVSEVALSVVLVAGAALMMQAFWGMSRLDTGFETDNVLTMQVSLPEAKYDRGSRAVFFAQLTEQMAALPGVESAAAVNILPFTFWNSSSGVMIDGVELADDRRPPAANFRVATPDYFATLGMRVIEGRGITPSDRAATAPVAVVNRAFVRRILEDAPEPVGRRIRFSRDGEWIEIVGVVTDIRHNGFATVADPEVYLSYAQAPRASMMLVLKTTAEPMSIADAAVAKVWELDSDQPVEAVQTFEELMSAMLFVFRLPTQFMVVFACGGLILAAVGLYGVIAFLVAQRTHEIGVRVALGARGGDVLGLVAKKTTSLTAIGLLLGLAGAVGIGIVLGALFEGVTGSGIPIYTGVSALLAVVALLATVGPALRAARIDPVDALRAE